MKTLLIGLVVGAACGIAVQRFLLQESEGAGRGGTRGGPRKEADPASNPKPRPDTREAELLARIAELEALLGQKVPLAAELSGVPIPTTEEGIDLLVEEFERTGDLDRLLAAIRALLRQGEKGYPKLARLLMKIVTMGMKGAFNDEQVMLQRVVPALRIAMDHEKELVGFVSYLLSTPDAPIMLRTGAMGAAMFLAMNKVPGSEAFAPALMQLFLAGGAAAGGDQAEMLVQAMGFLKQKEAVDPLLALLKDPARADLHRVAIQALGMIGDPRGIAAIAARLDPQSGDAPYAEMEALGRIGSPEAKLAAENYLTGLGNDDVFFQAAGNYLRASRSDSAVGLIRDRFRKSPSSGSLWNVIWSLRNVPTPAAGELLAEIAESSRDDNIRAWASNLVTERRKAEAEVK